MAADEREVFHVADLEIRSDDGLVLAAGRAVVLSVREFQLLVELARRHGSIVSRDALYRAVWGASLRPGDRSVDVYIHKLRVKLERALPGWRFVHTHVGFGYRFQAEASRVVHIQDTAR